ncbi:putative ABC1 protein [Platanthera guangdongensis]|uniref:ABC1 protein n=1 Tax=Platanthera guangdongensis TaxID=2320717 RepID=A0ABR2LE26_9ASPA
MVVSSCKPATVPEYSIAEAWLSHGQIDSNKEMKKAKSGFDVTIQARSSAELARKFRQVKQEKADILHRKLRERKGKNIQEDVQVVEPKKKLKIQSLHPSTGFMKIYCTPEELDFLLEARNSEKCLDNFKMFSPHIADCIYAPAFAEMIFRNGFVHCDPHAANMMVLPLPSDPFAEVLEEYYNFLYLFRPGWGHASENPELPDALKVKGIIFLGPPAAPMSALALPGVGFRRTRFPSRFECQHGNMVATVKGKCYYRLRKHDGLVLTLASSSSSPSPICRWNGNACIFASGGVSPSVRSSGVVFDLTVVFVAWPMSVDQIVSLVTRLMRVDIPLSVRHEAFLRAHKAHNSYTIP